MTNEGRSVPAILAGRCAMVLILAGLSLHLGAQQGTDPAVAAQNALAKCQGDYIACAVSCRGACDCETIRDQCRAKVNANVTPKPRTPAGGSPNNPGGGSPDTPPVGPPDSVECALDGSGGKPCTGDNEPCTYDLCKNGKCTSQSPSVKTTLTSQIFYITPEPRMPVIIASAQVSGVEPDPTGGAQFKWNFTISYTSPFGRKVELKLPEVLGGPTYQPTFPSIRGGKLTARATLVREGGDCVAANQVAEVRGLDPSFADVKAALGGNLDLARMVCHESAKDLQFENVMKGRKGQPLIERSKRGTGVGIMQITNPRPSDDAFWNWRANIREGMKTYDDKGRVADAYYKKLSKLKPPAPELSPEQKRQNQITLYNGGFYWRYVDGKWVAKPPLHPLGACAGKKQGDKVTLNAKKGTWDVCRSYYDRVMSEKGCE